MSAIGGVVREWIAFVVCLSLLAFGLLGRWFGWTLVEDAAFITCAGLGLVLCTTAAIQALRARRPSVDVLAILALAGALAVHELVAAAVVALMLTTGQLLEARAQSRAARDLSNLIDRAPRTARRRYGSAVEVVPADDVQPGDIVVVGPGELTPVDGRLRDAAVFDESALTGEPLPVDHDVDDLVRSGIVNAGSAVELLATSSAAESTYAGVVRLVEQARANTAPVVRVADRIAAVFVPLALIVAGLAWASSKDPVRAVAVLVIATPCPLLLAAPIAIMAGLSRATRAGVIVKGGSALERLAGGTVLLLDKTGTITRGHPTVASVVAAPGSTTRHVLRFAASVDQMSPHVLATAVMTAARQSGVALRPVVGARERAGYGIEGEVDGHRVRVGKLSWVVGEARPSWVRQTQRRSELDGQTGVYVGVDGEPAGVIVVHDPIRPDAPRMIRAMHSIGLNRIVLVSGDRPDIAQAVGRLVGVDAVYADQDPASKVEVVQAEAAFGPTIMTGDGVNDAPAMAAAHVGVALAARGSSAASEAADVVLTVDRIDALADAVLIARRSRRIAFTAAAVGMSLALGFMLWAAWGRLEPTVGALVQEGIDLLAISIALTGLIPRAGHTVALPDADREVALDLREEHRSVGELVEQIRVVADSLDGQMDLGVVRTLVGRLNDELLPHERRDEEQLLPVVARALGGPDPTAALSRTHAEIEQQVARLDRLIDECASGPIAAEDVVELRRSLYGLYAILRLHNAQEDESAFGLLPDS